MAKVATPEDGIWSRIRISRRWKWKGRLPGCRMDSWVSGGVLLYGRSESAAAEGVEGLVPAAAAAIAAWHG